MPETIRLDHGTAAKWLWYNIMSDLKQQGGLGGVLIDPSTVIEHGCGGEYQGNRFFLTWIYNHFLLITMSVYSQPLIDAFAKVVGYQPFCRYRERGGLITVEWDKDDPNGRFKKLIEEKRTNLEHLPLPENS